MLRDGEDYGDFSLEEKVIQLISTKCTRIGLVQNLRREKKHTRQRKQREQNPESRNSTEQDPAKWEADSSEK